MSRHPTLAGRASAATVAIPWALTAVGIVLLQRNGESVFDGFNLVLVVVGTVYAATGWLLRARVPGNRLGTVFLIAGWLWASDFFLEQFAVYGLVTAPGAVPGAIVALWLSLWLWVPGTMLLLFAVPVLFPDGGLPSPRWRPFVVLVVVATAVSVIGHAGVWWSLPDGLAALDQDFNATAVPGLAGLLADLGDTLVFLVAPIGGLTALVIRYRRSRGVVRQQMRWFTFAVTVSVLITMGSQLLAPFFPAVNAVTGPAFALIPISLTIAILRYRLYDIDRLIGRTLAYAIVTALLAAVFVGTNLLLQAAVAGATSGNTLTVAVSTLLVAALFQPIRRRVQAPIDRRFNRARVDGERVVAAFAGQLRDQVDLERLRSAAVAAVDDAVAPAVTSMWLRGTR